MYIIGYGNGDERVDGSPYVDWTGDRVSTFVEALRRARKDHKDELSYQKSIGGDGSETVTYIGKLPEDGYAGDAEIVLSIEGSRSKEYDWE